MFLIGPALGTAVTIHEVAIKKLEVEYQKLREAREKAQQDAMREVRRYVDELGQQTAAAQAKEPTETGGKAPDEPAAGHSPKA
jgi:hypothetical protein